MSHKFLLIILLLFINIISKDNTFNQFTSSNGGVNIVSGDAGFSHKLFAVKGYNKMDLSASIAYSSNVHMSVTERNDKASTGWLGLGWNLSSEKIICQHNNTAILDDDKYFYSNGSSTQEIIEDENGKFWLKNDPYWQIERVVETEGIHAGLKIKGWNLTNANGKKFVFGDPDGTRTDRNVVRNTFWYPQELVAGVCENGYVGASTSKPEELYPIGWDLSETIDMFQNSLSYEYTQFTSPVKTGGELSDIEYTKEVYLSRIYGINDDEINFYISDKNEEEYLDPNRIKSEPDVYAEIYETQKLDSVNVKIQGEKFRSYVFCYTSLSIHEDAHFEKRLLSSIVEKHPSGKELSRTSFQYYDDVEKWKAEDTEGASNQDGYNLGAISKVTYPECASVEYKYKKQILDDSNGKSKEWQLSKYDPEEVTAFSAGGRQGICIQNGVAGGITTYIRFWDGQQWNSFNRWSFTNGIVVGGGEDYVIAKKPYENIFNIHFWNEENMQFDDAVSLNPIYSTTNANHEVTIKTFAKSFYVIDRHKDSNHDETCKFKSYNNNYYDTEEHIKIYHYTVNPTKEEIKRIDVPDQNQNMPQQVIGLPPVTDYFEAHKWDEGQEDFDISENVFVHKIWRAYPGNTTVDKRKDIIYRFDGEKWSRQLFERDRDADDFETVFAGDNFVFVPYKPNTKEYICFYSWNGKSWDDKKIEFPHAKDMLVAFGNGFVTVNHIKNNEYSMYYWNGEDWVKKYKNEGNRYTANLLVNAGGNTFSMAYPLWIKRSVCRNKKRQESVKIFRFNGESWGQEYSGRFDLPRKHQKEFFNGVDKVSGRKTRTSYRNPVEDFSLHVRQHDGYSWKNIEKDVANGRSKEWNHYRIDTTMMVKDFGNITAVMYKTRYHNTNGGTDCDKYSVKDIEFDPPYNANWITLLHNYKRSYKNKFSGYVVSEKRVFDGITIQNDENSEENFEIENKIPGITSVFYNFDVDSGAFFNTTHGTAMYKYVEVISEDGSKHSFKTNVDGMNPKTLGKTYEEIVFDKDGRELSKTEIEYTDGSDEINVLKDPSWPSNVFLVKEASRKVNDRGIITEISKEYNVKNGLVWREKNTVRDTSITKTTTYSVDEKYFSDETNTLQNEFIAKNQIVYPLEVVTHATGIINGNQLFSKSISGKRYSYKKLSENYFILDKEYVWYAKSDYFGNLPDIKTSGEWIETGKITQYGDNGKVLEKRTGSGFYDNNGIPSSNYFGHNNLLSIAELSSTRWEEASFLPGDYNDNYEDNGDYFFDKENKWQNVGCVVETPSVKHFGSKAIHADASADGVSRTFNNLYENRPYIFAAWIYPVSMSDVNTISMKVNKVGETIDFKGAGADLQDKLELNKWQRIEREINPDDIRLADGSISPIDVTISSNGAEFYLEDVRFHPIGTFPLTSFYNETYNKIAAVDGYGNGIVSEWDDQGRVIKTARAGTKGVDTVLTETEYYCAPCNKSKSSTFLSELNINPVPFEFDPEIQTYNLYVQNFISEIKLTAKAEDKYSTLGISYGSTNKTYECPCGLSEVISLIEGQPLQIIVTVYAPIGNLSKDYVINIERLEKCWVYKDKENTSDNTRSNAQKIAVLDDVPVAIFKDEDEKLNFVTNQIFNWLAPPTGTIYSGSVDNFDITNDNSNLYVAFNAIDDEALGDGIYAKSIATISSYWQQMGTTAISQSYTNEFKIYSLKDAGINNYSIYVAYLADKYEEESITPPVEDFVEYRLYIKKWNEIGATWEDVIFPQQLPIGANGMNIVDFELQYNNDHQLAVAYTLSVIDDPNSSDDDIIKDENDGLYVVEYNPLQSSWEAVGSNTPSFQDVERFSFVNDGNDRYLLVNKPLNEDIEVKDIQLSSETRCYKYDSNSEDWDELANNSLPIFETDGADNIKMLSDGEEPVITFSNVSNKKDISTITWNSSESKWETVGNPVYGSIKNREKDEHLDFIIDGDSKLVSTIKKEDRTPAVFEYLTDCSDANAEMITLKNGSSNIAYFPSFREYIVNYYTEVKPEVNSVTINVIPSDAGASSVLFNGIAGNKSGSVWSNNITLNTGENEIKVTVVADDDKTQTTYTYVIKRDNSTSKFICAIEVYEPDAGQVYFTPDFDPGKFDGYTLNVSSEINEILVKPVSTGNEKIEVNGSNNPSGYISDPYQLHYGKNKVTVTVKTASGEVVDYVIDVIRETNPNHILNDFTVASGLAEKFEPSFNSGDFKYDIEVANATTDVQLILTAPQAKIELQGDDFVSGSTSNPISLDVGMNPVVVKTTHEASGVVSEYNVSVFRKPETNAQLSSITLYDEVNNETVNLDNTFISSLYNYSSVNNLPTSCEKLQITPVSVDPAASVYVNEQPVVPGDFVEVDMFAGINNIDVTVVSTDNVSITYNFNIYKDAVIEIPTVYLEKDKIEIYESRYGLDKYTYTCKIKLSEASAVEVKAKVVVTGGTASAIDNGATDPKDFELLNTDYFTFLPCEVEKEFEIEVYDDNVIEGDETIEIALEIDPSSSANLVLPTVNLQTITIIDDDFPKVSFDSPSTSIDEGDDNVSGQIVPITVTMDPAPISTVNAYYEITYKSIGLEDDEFEDITTTKNVLTFSPTDLNETIQIKIFGDTKVEPNDYLQLSLSTPKGVDVGDIPNHELTIKNDDLPPALVYFDKISFTDVEGTMRTYGVTVNLTRELDTEVRVPFTLNDPGVGFCTYTDDYYVDLNVMNPENISFVYPNGELVFSPGETSIPITYRVPPDGNYDEGTEKIVFSLGEPVGFAALDENKKVFTHYVKDPTSYRLTLLTDGGASTNPSESILLNKGEEITITAFNSNVSSSYFYEWKVLSGNGAVIGNVKNRVTTISLHAGDVTIQPVYKEGYTVVRFAPNSNVLDENETPIGEEFTTNVYLSKPLFPDEQITIDFYFNGDATEGEDFEIVSPSDKTITLTADEPVKEVKYKIKEDLIKEGSEWFHIMHNVTSGIPNLLTEGHSVEIKDEVYTVSFDKVANESGENDDDFQVEISVSPIPDEGHVLKAEVSLSGTATRGDDYTSSSIASSASTVFQFSSTNSSYLIDYNVIKDGLFEGGAGSTEDIIFTITPIDDPVTEESLIVGDYGTFTHTIKDCDCRIVTFVGTPYGVHESSTYIHNFTVSLTPPPTIEEGTITIPYTISGDAKCVLEGQNQDNADAILYEPTGKVTFGVYESEFLIPIRIIDDNIREGTEQIRFTLQSVNGGPSIGQYAAHGINIIDNEKVIHVNNTSTYSGADIGSSWGTAFSDLQAGLDKAKEYSDVGAKNVEVWVAMGDGSYIPPTENGFTVKSNIKLYGGFQGIASETSIDDRNLIANKTEISGGGTRVELLSMVKMSAEDKLNSIVVDGFKFSHAFSNATKNATKNAVKLNVVDINISNCIFEDNNTYSSLVNFDMTKAMTLIDYNYNLVFHEFTDCEFKNNNCRDSALVNLTNAQNVNLTRTDFVNNSFTDGGALIVNAVTQTVIRECEFRLNQTNESENNGDVYYGIAATITNPNTNLLIENSSFVNNFSKSGSSFKNNCLTIYADQSLIKDATISNCKFFNNNTDYFNTRFIYNNSTLLKVENSSFYYSKSNSEGAISYVGLPNLSGLTFINCSGYINDFVGGSAIELWEDQTPAPAPASATISDVNYNIKNSVFWSNGNNNYNFIDSKFDIKSSCLNMKSYSEITENIGYGKEDISNFPNFKVINNVLQIRDNSPCVNNGTDSYGSYLLQDITKQARIQGRQIDIGAYETSSDYDYYFARFENVTKHLTESNSSEDYIIKLNKPAAFTLRIPFAVTTNAVRGSSQGDGDFYINTGSDEIVFNTGSDETSISIYTTNDAISEGNEFIRINLTDNENVYATAESGEAIIIPNDLSNIIAYYDMFHADIHKDISNNDNTVYSRYVNSTFGIHGDDPGAFDFREAFLKPGSRCYEVSPINLPLGSADKSISAFIKIDPSMYLVNSSHHIGGFGSVYNTDIKEKSFRLEIFEDKFRVGANTNGGGWNITNYSISENGLVDNNWHNVVITYDSDAVCTTRLFVDGVLISSTTGEVFNTLLGDITIGHREDNPISFPGCIDEFRIYDKELNQNEINEINNYVIID